MSLDPQNEPPLWRGITDVHSVVADLMAADRGSELGVSLPSLDSDSEPPPADAQGVEPDDSAADDDSGDEATADDDGGVADVDTVAAESADVPDEEGGDTGVGGEETPGMDDPVAEGSDSVDAAAVDDGEGLDSPDDAGEVGFDADGLPDNGEQPIPDSEELPRPDVSSQAEDATEDLELPEPMADELRSLTFEDEAAESPLAVDDPVEGRDEAQDVDLSQEQEREESLNLDGGIEFESSITPEVWEWKAEDHSSGGWADAVQVPDSVSMPTDDVTDYAMMDRQGGY